MFFFFSPEFSWVNVFFPGFSWVSCFFPRVFLGKLFFVFWGKCFFVPGFSMVFSAFPQVFPPPSAHGFWPAARTTIWFPVAADKF